MSNKQGEMVLLEQILIIIVIISPFVLLVTPLHDVYIFDISVVAWLPLILLFLVPCVGIYVALSDKDYQD